MSESKGEGLTRAEADLVRALPTIARVIEEWLFEGASDADTIRHILGLVSGGVELRTALRECQRTLAMMVEPQSVRQTSVATAYAACVSAEAKARRLLGDAA